MNELFDISGRNVLVVGGTSGIGHMAAKEFARAGCNVGAVGRRKKEAEEAAEFLEDQEIKTFGAVCDVTVQESVDWLVERVTAEFGGLDILVYAAGITHKKPITELSIDDWNRVMDTNVTGALRVCQAFHPLLKQSKFPRIVTIASLTSYVSFHQVSPYSASKAALLNLTKSMAEEWAADRISVNAVVPGVFVTDLNRDLLMGTDRGRELQMRTPMKRFGDTSELAGAILFLSSDAASFITGIGLPVDGGFLASGVNQ